MKWDPTLEDRGIATIEEMNNFFANMDFTIKVERHQGPKAVQWNIVLYFTPLTGKYLNYIARWEPTNYQKGPGGKVPYMALKFWLKKKGRVKQTENGQPRGYFRPRHSKQYGLPRPIEAFNIEDSDITSNPRLQYTGWHFHRGMQQSKYDTGEKLKYSDNFACYITKTQILKHRGIKRYEWCFPITYKEAVRGYKIFNIPRVYNEEDDNTRKFNFNHCNWVAVKGVVIYDLLEYDTSNFLAGKKLYNHNKIIEN